MASHTDILFADLKIPIIDRDKALFELAKVSDNLWYWNKYRNAWMLPLMTANGNGGEKNLQILSSQDSDGRWTAYAPESIIRYTEDNIFNWIKMRPRVTLLKTLTGSKNNEHVDCGPSEVGLTQHKFRHVLQGNSESLYFVTAQGPIYAPKTDKPFIMDGGWPHGMVNDFPKEKVTLCIGAPWLGSEKYPEFDKVLLKTGLHLPANLNNFIENRKNS